MYLDEILIMFRGLHLSVNVVVFVCKTAKEKAV